MLLIGERVICTKGEENWNTLVLGKTYEIADRCLDSLGQWIYKLKSDDGQITNWIEQWWTDEPIELVRKPYFIPLSTHREEKLKQIGL